jgi:3-phenylpropionate/cinnamic acid dioxygenase small subunit
MGPDVDLVTFRSIEAFLFREARLLEQDRLEDWLECVADDIRYRMPVRENVQPRATVLAGGESFALFDDDKASLRLRVSRVRTGLAHAEVPPSVTQRLITNVMAAPASTAGHFEVGSNFMVYQERRGKHGVTFFGHRDDILRKSGDGFVIVERRILLAQAVLPTTISIFF